MPQIAVHFIRAGKNDFGFRQESPGRFEDIESSHGIGFEVITRILKRSRQRNLSRQMQDDVRIAMRRPVAVHLIAKANVEVIDAQLESLSKISLVVPRTGSVEIIGQEADFTGFV